MTNSTNAARDRARLIDHFKRLYSIVAGLAITEAVRRLFPLSPSDVPWPQFWMFCTFLITIVPIFHGGDRSLDVKHIDSPAYGPFQKLSYVWDVYMLVLTSILFVCIAEALPRLDGSRAFKPGDVADFYHFLGFMLAFDVFVLIVDVAKTKPEARAALGSYALWVPANVLLSLACFYVTNWFPNDAFGGTAAIQFGTASLQFSTVTAVIFAVALVRTTIDYSVGGSFLFP